MAHAQTQSAIQTTKWQSVTLTLIAALMGIGQNGLLVSLPLLVAQGGFSLSTWAVIIAVGSVLFLPAAPFWGRFSDHHGPKFVVLQALTGMAVSFALLLAATLGAQSSANQWPWLALAVLARVIYGLTVAGMVPANQHWAVLLAGEARRMQAITSISIGLSLGRLAGPLIASAVLVISPYASLTLMLLLPVLAALVVSMMPHCEDKKDEPHSPAGQWLAPKAIWPYMGYGLAVCAAIALLQYNLTPMLNTLTEWSANNVSQAIGYLLTLSGIATLVVQVLVVKKQRLSTEHMLGVGAISLVAGYALLLLPSVTALVIAMLVISGACALLIPAYTSQAMQQIDNAPGKVSGYIAMAHTLGYGLASLLATLTLRYPPLPTLTCILLSCTIVIGILIAKRPLSSR
ncbi:MFS transporter [Salinivibrio sp. ES.052]|uniref:MFS transporter n=1 Tax=Salinivibrio sp. ES.052 TaxID=1882823 RepID=UPI000927FF7E|nr:MFS transporter [Salinivibrio sp. ES.052]SIO35624.1 Predicted arabinose efflux permease, MFS family [Salinivibrio sp. ES.052]